MTKTRLTIAISSILAAGTMSTTPPVLAQDLDDDFLPEHEAIADIIVTGSRIPKDVFTSSAPMDVIYVDQASIQGIANLGQLLQTSTVAAGSQQVTPATSFQFLQNGGLGAQTISLRGLGANRTLVLLNGRRAGPAGVQGGVSSFDLNVLPLSAIERVEFLKDGASSIYGSDAVAGVVNIITRKDDGGTIDAFVSVPSDSGGEESRLSASWGKSFDRGNFRVTAAYSKKDHLRRGDRNYFDCGNLYIFDQTTGQRADNIDPRTGQFYCFDLLWGHVWIYDYADPSNIPSNNFLLSQFDYDGDLGQYIPGYAVDPANPSWLTQPGGFFPVRYDTTSDAVTNADHPFQDRESLNPKVELITIYAEGEYELTDNLTAYTEVLLNRRTTEADSYRQYWSYIYSGDFDFGSLGTGIPGGGSSVSAAAGWFGEQWLSPAAITDHADSDVEIDYQRFVAGLRGSITENWDWDFAFIYSKSDGEYTDDVIFADAIFDFNFLHGSCVGMTSSVRGVPCVDVPWLDPELLRGNVSQEVSDFLFGVETGTTEYTQLSLEGFVTGQTVDLPAGPLGVAAGFHYRKDRITDTPGPITLDPSTGENNSWGYSAAGITTGDDSTIAVFGEVNVPLITEKPWFDNLTLNASARYTEVDSYGDATTWKVGLNWQIVSSLRLRANKGTSFRTPALFELFLANQTSGISQRSDPCIRYEEAFQAGDITQNVRDNCAADPRGLPPDYYGGAIRPTVITGGGFGVLQAETSDSKTIGLIWQPQFADLSVSVDYFDIEINDAVDQLGGAQIIASCYESNFGFAYSNSEPLCDLFDRSGINMSIDNVMNSFINIAQQRNRGYDISAQYATEIGPGSLTINLQATKQVEDIKALFEETAEDLNGLVGDPVWVAQSRITYDLQAWIFFWGMDYIGDSSSEERWGGTTVMYRGVEYDGVLSTDPIYYHSFSASYDFGDRITVLAGLANAFDENPPQLTPTGEYSMVGNSVFVSQYDPLGRRYFVNVTMNFD